MLNDADSAALQTRLEIHRRNLQYLLNQRAQLGIYTPAHIQLQIDNIRVEIVQIKEQLRALNITVNDHPNDAPQGPPLAAASNPPPPPPHGPESATTATPPPRGPKMRAADYLGCFTFHAEDEAQELSSFFVDIGLFRAMMGNPKRPESIIVFGKPGHGKTSHCLEMLKSVRPQALGVHLMFGDIAQFERPDAVTADHYLQIIRERTLEALRSELDSSPRRQQKFSTAAHALRYLQAAEQLSGLRQIDLASDPAVAQTVDTLSRQRIRGWLHTLAHVIAAGAGFESVYVLLDGVGADSLSDREWRQTIAIIKPFLNSVATLRGCGFAFKCFFHDDLSQRLTTAGINWERIFAKSYSLVWTQARLQHVLSRRLQSCRSRIRENSQRTPVERFADLCEIDSGLQADEELARAAQGSPRRLLQMARSIIEEHCNREPERDYISVATFRTILP
jgi:hypothetical protein